MFTRYQYQQRRWLSIVVGLFALLTCLRVWIGPTMLLDSAQAQIPDSGMQRKLILDEVRQTNKLLGEIKHLLQDETFNVRIQGADNQAPAPEVIPAGRETPES